jgi:hypothetical protein
MLTQNQDVASSRTTVPLPAAAQSCFAARLSRQDAPIAARVKVLDPLMTMGPPSPAHALAIWAKGLRLRVNRPILRGSMVQVRIGERLGYGRVQICLPCGTEFEVSVARVDD